MDQKMTDGAGKPFSQQRLVKRKIKRAWSVFFNKKFYGSLTISDIAFDTDIHFGQTQRKAFFKHEYAKKIVQVG